MHGTAAAWRQRQRERERCAMTRHAAFPCTTYDRFSMGSRTFLSNPSTRETIHVPLDNWNHRLFSNAQPTPPSNG